MAQVELQRVAIHPLPTPDNLQLAVPGPRINFNHLTQPFVQLLTASNLSFVLATVALVEYCQRIVSAIQEIFYRLVNSPVFDPTHPSFKVQIDQLEEQIVPLQLRVNQLQPEGFWDTHNVSQDIKTLKKLHYEISRALPQLNYFVNTLEPRQHLFPIYEQLVDVRDAFQDLNDQMDDFCLTHGNRVIDRLQETFNVFMVGVELPKEIHKQLLQTWADFDDVFLKRLRHHYDKAKPLYSKISDLRDQVQILKKRPNEEIQKSDIDEPLKLRNKSNSCYLASALQCLLCIDQIREKFNEPIERDPNKLDEYQKKLTIQHELLQFIEVQKRTRTGGEAMSQMEFILFLLGGPDINRLREAIFQSEFHPDLTMDNGLTEQHDAAYILELYIDMFLSDICQFKWREHTSAPAFPGLEFLAGGKNGLDETLSILQVPLRTQARYHKLDILVKALVGKHHEREKKVGDQRRFDPKDGEIVAGKEKEAEAIINAAPAKVDHYHQWYRISQLPPVMVIQFKRFTGLGTKDKRPVELPADGILDLTDYYDPPEGAPKQARYKIKGMVRHTGETLRLGHYVSEVEINGKYFHCDDTKAEFYEKVTEKDFFGHKDPYLLFLERLPDEEEEAQPQA